MQQIHGLRIASAIELPGLALASDDLPADVVLEVSDRARQAPLEPVRLLYQSPRLAVPDASDAVLTVVADARGAVCFRYSDGTAVDVMPGETPVRITAAIAPGQILEDLTTYLYGAVLGFVLRSSGTLALHASCVANDDGALLLAGDSGAGKSTTAAALSTRGWRVLSDDLTALSPPGIVGAHWRAHRAFAHVRLWPSSEPLLFGRSDVLQPITPGWEKLRFPLDGGTFGGDAVPVRGILVIGRRADDAGVPRVEGASAAENLLSLTTLSYANYLHDSRSRAIELEQLGALLREVPVRVLVSRHDPARIGELCEVIEREACAMRDASPGYSR